MLFIVGALLGFKGPIYCFFHDQLQGSISRVSISAYAMQYIMVSLLTYSRTEDIYINLAKTISYCSCTIISTLAVGFIFCVLVEMPLHKLLAQTLQGDPNKYVELH